MLHADAVDALNPATAVEGEAGFLGYGDQPFRVGVGDKDVIEVDGLVTGSKQYFYGYCSGNAYFFHLSFLRFEFADGYL
ncbi:hypothetical protein ES708_32736 [subsurface metagenome]